MFDTRTAQQKEIDRRRVHASIERLGVTEQTPVGVLAAFEAFDSSYRILVGVGVSTLDGGAKHLVVETHVIPARRSRSPGENCRNQFRLTGEYYGSADPTFIGLVDFASDAWRPAMDALDAGQMRSLPVAGLTFFGRPMT